MQIVAAPFRSSALADHRAAAPVPAPAPAPTAPGSVSVGTYNVHNLYDTQDDPNRNDDIHTPAQYSLALAKTAAAIIAMGTPDILGLQEIENDNVLKDLLTQPALRDAGYAAKYVPGNDMWSHDDAFLYKTAKVTLDKLTAPNPVANINDGPRTVDPTLLFATPPAVGEFTVHGDAGSGAGTGSKLVVIDNHMKSKIGGAANQTRQVAQGNFIGQLVDDRVKADPSTPVVVVGDLNSGGTDAQFQALLHRADGSARLVDTSDKLPASDRFSYSFHGQHDQLDHVLVSAANAGAVTGAALLHFNTQADRSKVNDPSSEQGASDHDPATAVLKLG